MLHILKRGYFPGNDIDGYKTVMPDILTGTNTGPSAYGPATGKKVCYSGTAVTYVQKVVGCTWLNGYFMMNFHLSPNSALQTLVPYLILLLMTSYMTVLLTSLDLDGRLQVNRIRW